MAITNVNGVQIFSYQYAVQTVDGDVGPGGFVDDPGRSSYYGHPSPASNYTVGLVNEGLIKVVAGTPTQFAGSYGPGRYAVFFPPSVYSTGVTYEKYTRANGLDTAFPVAIYNGSAGLTYLTNNGSIIGGVELFGDGPVSVLNTGFVDSLGVDGTSGLIQNTGVIAAAYAREGAIGASALGGTINVLNTGTIYSVAPAEQGGETYALVSTSSGTVTNQGTVLGGVNATAVVNSELIQAASAQQFSYAINAASVTNLAGGTIVSTGSASGIEADTSVGAVATILNAGLIQAAGRGVSLDAGSVNNLATGTIMAGTGYGVIAQYDATVKNAGTIIVTGSRSITFQGHNFVLGGGALLDDGGTLINQTGALISTRYGFGVALEGSDYVTDDNSYSSALLNFGTILSGGTTGAEIAGTASVVNGTGAVISGSQYGVVLVKDADAVSNAGTILARPPLATAIPSIGVDFATETSGAYLTNAATGTINAGTGVLITGDDGTVLNAGVIAARGRLTSGVTLADGGTVINQLGGTVSGYYLFKSYGVAISGAAGTVSNLGTIFARSKGVYLGAGGTIINGGTIGVVAGTAGYDAVQVVGTLTSTVFNTGTIGAAGDTVNVNGITAFGGLYLNNRPAGLIAANNYAIRSTSGVTTLLNSGTIVSVGTDPTPGIAGTARGLLQAVYLSGTGGASYVSNAASGTILGRVGINLEGAPGTIVNDGTIDTYKNTVYYALNMYLTASGVGVVFGDGGSLSNSGLIQYSVNYYVPGTVHGFSVDKLVNVTNSGTIFGVHLPSGSVTNQASGTIRGVSAGGGATILNAGSIYNVAGGTAVGNSSATSGPYGSQTVASTLTNLAGGIISATGTIVENDSGTGYSHFSGRAVALYNAAVLSNGTILAQGTGIALTGTVAGAVINNGLIAVTGLGVSIANGTLINTGKILADPNSYASYVHVDSIFGIYLDDPVSARAAQIPTGTVTNDGIIHGAVGVGQGMIYNGPGDTIYGVVYAGADGSGTLVNAGTIGRITDNPKNPALGFLGSSADRLVVQAGAAFIGGIQGNGVPTTLEFASGAGRLAGFGSSVTNFGQIQFDQGAAWTIEGSGAGLGASIITGLAPGDGIDIDGFVAQSSSYLNGILSLTSGSLGVVSLQLPGNFTTSSFITGFDGAGGTDVTVACFLAGTHIRVPGGEAAVEGLAIGDRVLTVCGAARPIHWIGRRSYAGRFLARNPRLLPICFAAGSLGEGLPLRDLHVSPDHALMLDGLLIPAAELVNGTTVRRVPGRARVDYVHIELASHDAVLAEGAPAETFLDDDSRNVFQNAEEYARLYPHAPPPGLFCAPRVVSGVELEAIRQRLGQFAVAA